MNKILKSFMISFVKSWVETIGTILFLLMMAAIVLGMLTTPLQINNKMHKVQGPSNTPDYYVSSIGKNFTDNFIEKYFVQNTDNTTYEFTYPENGIVQGVATSNNTKIVYPDFTKPSKNPEKFSFLQAMSDDLRKKIGITNNNFSLANVKNDLNQQEPDTIRYLKEIRTELLDVLKMPASAGKDKQSLENYLQKQNMEMILSPTFVLDIFHYYPKDHSFSKAILDEILRQHSKEYQWQWATEFTYSIGKSPNMTTFDFTVAPTSKSEMSQVILDGGATPKSGITTDKTMEVAVSSAYFKANKMKLGQIIINDALGYKLKVVGYGINYETILNGSGFNTLNGSDVDTYGYIYLSADNLQILFEASLEKPNSSPLSVVHQTYRIKQRNVKEQLSDILEADAVNSSGILKYNEYTIINQSSYSPVKNLQNIRIQVVIYIVLGIIVLTLAFVFLNFVIKKELNQSRVQIGIFKAMGYTRRELSWIFALKTLITLFAGLVLGYFVSFPLQIYAAGQFKSSVAIYFSAIYASPSFIIILFFLVPGFFMIISYLLTLRDLKESSLALMNNSVRVNKTNWFIVGLAVIFFPFGIIMGFNKMRAKWNSHNGRRFVWRMRYGFTTAGMGKFVMVTILIGFSAFMFMALVSASTVMNTLITQGFSTINKDADYQLTWGKKNAFKVAKDSKNPNGENQFILDDRYYTPYPENAAAIANDVMPWVPKDVRYVDYAGEGYDKAAAKYLDIATAKTISAYFSNTIDYFTTTSELNGVKNIMNFNPRALGAYLALIFADIKNPTDDFKEIIKDLKSGLIGLIPWITSKDMQTKANWYNLQNYNNENRLNRAMYLRDFKKLACEISLMNFDGTKILPSCNSDDTLTNIVNNASNDNQNGGSKGTSSMTDNIGGLFGSFFAASLMLKTDKDYSPLIATNTYLFDHTKDVMYYVLEASGEAGANISSPTIRLFDTTSDAYGTIGNGYTLSDGAKSAVSSLANSSDQKNSATNPLNAIASYRLARGLDKKVGDTVVLYLGDTLKVPVYFKIVGINQNDTFLSDFSVDNKTFLNQVVSFDETNAMTKKSALIGDGPIFNSIISQNTAISGSIDLKHIAESIRTLKMGLKTFTVASANNAAFGGSIIGDLMESIFNAAIPGLDISNLLAKVDKNAQLLNNATLSAAASSSDIDSGVTPFTPYKITKALVNEITNIATMMMSIFIVLDAVLLLIILVVIMNIVVDEAQRIILTMRSIGYKNRTINWMVMGNYIIWAAISFVISYILILMLWFVVSNLIWNRYSILINIPFTPEIPLIAFAVITFILLGGWLAAMYRINHHPLTNITD